MSCIKQSPSLRLSLPRRILIFILGFLDNLLFGGAVFGWPQLVFVLKVEGLFGDLCDSYIQNSTNSNSNQFFLNVSHCSDYENSAENSTLHEEEFQNAQKICAAQDEKFALIYTVAVVCYGVPGVLVGYMLHYAGLMLTRMLGGFMVASSFVFLAVTTYESPNWLFAATVLLSMGGNQLRMSNMQFGDLFPSVRSTTITVLTGVYAASATLFILFPIGASFGISRPIICYCLAAYAFISAVASVVMPCHHIPFENDNEGYDVKERKRTSSSSSLLESLNTLSSYLHLYWFLILLVCVNFYQQIYNLWITASTCSEEEVGLYSSLFSYSNLVSVFCAPIGGIFTDFLVRRARKNEVDHIAFLTKEIQANFTPLFLTTLFTMLMHCCVFFFSETAILISLVSMIIVRPCVVAISTAYLRIRFPGSHFNRLLGIYCTIASAFMFVQYPFFKLAQDNYYLAQGILAFMLAISFLNPLHILWTSRVKRWVKERDNITDQVLVENFTKSI
ncbi:UNVERIFIED_CONTAM: hypothetical protein RMT77_002357 [Armadillidium vulgare]